jgi:hypothetical protein
MRMILHRPLLALAALGALAGCSSVESLIPHYDPATAPRPEGASPRPSAQLPTNPAEKQIVLPVAASDINCPEIEVAEGGAAVRVGGAESASVRYQFNLGETARQCDPAGPGQASIKVGVAGNLVIGPAGSPGTYSVPLKIAVVQAADNKPVYSKTYTIQATADASSSGQFRIVADPIQVAMPTLNLANVYTIKVGFEGGTRSAAPRGKRGAGAG